MKLNKKYNGMRKPEILKEMLKEFITKRIDVEYLRDKRCYVIMNLENGSYSDFATFENAIEHISALRSSMKPGIKPTNKMMFLVD